jgi:hypothetical protein
MSTGVATWEPWMSAADLVAAADAEMYARKPRRVAEGEQRLTR